MNWGSVSAFFDMGGYGLYVWGSIGMCALVIAIECLGLTQRRRALLSLAAADAAEPRP